MTRRCAQRQYLLTPSPVVNAVFRYVLAVAARRHRIAIHAYCVLSSHYHLVLTDPHAELPAFQQLLGALIARALNALHGRRESFWKPGSYLATELADSGAIVDKTAYTLANPVAARAVQDPRQWPGLWSDPEDIGAAGVQVRRPPHFFDEGGDLPESEVLCLTAPPGFDSEEFRQAVQAALGERVALARAAGGGFLGLVRLRAQRPTDHARSEEPARRLRPLVASRSRAVMKATLTRLAEFVAGYRAALEAWRSGHRTVVFPAGTYWLRVGHCVECAGVG